MHAALTIGPSNLPRQHVHDLHWCRRARAAGLLAAPRRLQMRARCRAAPRVQTTWSAARWQRCQAAGLTPHRMPLRVLLPSATLRAQYAPCIVQLQHLLKQDMPEAHLLAVSTAPLPCCIVDQMDTHMLPSVPERSRAMQVHGVPDEQPAAAPAAATPASLQPGFRDLSLLSAALRPADATPAREGPGEGPAQDTGLGSLRDLSLRSAALRPADATPAREGPGEGQAQGSGLGSIGLADVVSEAAERLRRAQSGLAAAAEARDAVRMGTSASSGAGWEGSDPGCEARAARRLSSGSGSPTSRPASAAGPEAASASAEYAPLPAGQATSGGGRTPFDANAAPGAAGMPGAREPAAVACARGGAAAPTGVVSLGFRAPSGDVTLATRDAFDTINAMFRGALPQEAPWQASDPNPATRAAQPQAARAVARSALEPTVTISTRAAYEALSGMFAGALPHEEARGARAAAPAHAGSQGLGGARGLDAAQVPAPGRASSPGIGAPERTLVIYEDTQYGARDGRSGGGSREDSPEPPPEDSLEPRAFAPRPRSADERATGALDVYEDTQFGLAAGAGQGLGNAAAAGSAPRGAASAPLAVYEDTQFMGAGGSAGLGFAAGATPGAASPADAPAYEPTQYMSENMAPAAAAVRPRRALFGKRRQPRATPDAAAPRSPVLHAAGSGAQAAEAPAAAAFTPRQGAAGRPDGGLEGLGLGLEEGRSGGAGLDAWPDDTGDLLEDQENLAPSEGMAGSAVAAARAAAPGVLRDIGGDAAAAMGIALGRGEDIGSPLRRLRLVRAPAACGVYVYCMCMQQRGRTRCCCMLARSALVLICSRAPCGLD